MLPSIKLSSEKYKEIRAYMKETVYLSRQVHNVNLMASFGLAAFPDDALDISGALAPADRTMFRERERDRHDAIN